MLHRFLSVGLRLDPHLLPEGIAGRCLAALAIGSGHSHRRRTLRVRRKMQVTVSLALLAITSEGSVSTSSQGPSYKK